MIEREGENGGIGLAWNGMVSDSSHGYGVVVNVHYQVGSLGASFEFEFDGKDVAHRIVKHSVV